jgi:uncharacterized membrane protein YkoI
VRGVSTETEHGKTLYEVELTIDGHSRDVLIAADGLVAEVGEETAVASLPTPVKHAVEQEATAGKTLKVEAATRGGKVAYYEVHAQKNGKKNEVSIDPDGKLMRKEKDS